MKMIKGAALAAGVLGMLITASAAQAQYGPRGPGWGSPGWGGTLRAPMSDRQVRDTREGRVAVSRFVVAGTPAEALGHGSVVVASQSGDGPWIEPGQRAAYEAALIDALIGAGYETRNAGDAQAQVAQLRVTRQVLTPAEEKKSPVSGSAAVSVGTYGSAYGLAVNVDMTKPRPALISTRLDTRILDKDDGRVLWEGYATIATREGDDEWGEDQIASKLAHALFDNFPKADTIVPASAPTG